MKRGQDIGEFLEELRRRDAAKRDFFAPSDRIFMIKTQASESAILDVKGETFGITEHAHGQIAERTEIPWKYYDRMRREDPDLLGLNVNRWLVKEPTTRLVRTLDGNVRAFLSDRYRTIDNLDVINAVMPVIRNAGITTIASTALTDTHLYVQALSDKVKGEVVGKVVQAGIVLSNSEIGCGAVKLESLLYILSCMNGAIRPERLKRHHIGGRLDSEDESVFSDRTRMAIDATFLMKLKDTAVAMLDQTRFDEYLGTVREIQGRRIVRNESRPLSEVVEVTGNRFSFTQGEGERILENLIHGDDLSQWGMAQAVTTAANGVESYDRAIELERTGGEIIEMEKNDWEEIWRARA